jgi:hypothetical protein
MSEDVILNAGTTVEHQLTDGSWKRVPKITTLGAVGEQSDPKEKTTMEDRIKKYGSGLRDAPDKNLQGNYIPMQEVGDEHYDDFLLQQEFINRCRNQEEFNIRVNWSDGEVTGFLFKSLGFQFNEGSQEDWKMWTVNGKQNSRVIYSVDVTGLETVAAGSSIDLTASWVPSDITVKNAGGVIWTSSDEAIATVSDTGTVTAGSGSQFAFTDQFSMGTVTGVTAGTVIITAEVRGVVGSLTVEVTA